MAGQQGAAETSALLATAKNGESDRRRNTGAVVIGVLLTVLVLLGVYLSNALQWTKLPDNEWEWRKECAPQYQRHGAIAGDDFPYGRFTKSFVEVFANAPIIYILCVECDQVVVPRMWEDKHLLIDGRAYDVCVGDAAIKHGLKASQLHAAAIADATERNFDFVAIVEEDVLPDENIEWDQDQIDRFMFQLKTRFWSVARFGFRPFFMEREGGPHPGWIPSGMCSDQRCVCQKIASQLCEMPRVGCDMRSSDAYFVHSRVYGVMSRSLWNYDGDPEPLIAMAHVIDVGVMRQLNNQILVVPQWTYQERGSRGADDIVVRKAGGASYVAACVQGNAGEGALAAEVRSVSEENVPVDEELTKVRSVSDENVTVVEPLVR